MTAPAQTGPPPKSGYEPNNIVRVREIRDDWVLGTNEMADLLGVSRVTIGNYSRERNLPKLARGRFYLPDVMEWLRTPGLPGSPVEPEEASEYTQAQTELAQARKDKVDLEIRKLAGELVEVTEAHRALLGICQILASGLDAFPARWAPVLAEDLDRDPAQIAPQLTTAARELREELADHVRAFERDYKPSWRATQAPT